MCFFFAGWTLFGMFSNWHFEIPSNIRYQTLKPQLLNPQSCKRLKPDGSSTGKQQDHSKRIFLSSWTSCPMDVALPLTSSLTAFSRTPPGPFLFASFNVFTSVLQNGSEPTSGRHPLAKGAARTPGDAKLLACCFVGRNLQALFLTEKRCQALSRAATPFVKHGLFQSVSYSQRPWGRGTVWWSHGMPCLSSKTISMTISILIMGYNSDLSIYIYII